jgi:hypothetical protein
MPTLSKPETWLARSTNFTEGQWAALAIVAKTKPPSPETYAVIGKLLSQRQEWRELVALEKGVSHAS